MVDSVKDSNNPAARLYSMIALIVDCVIFWIRFHAELLFSLIRLFIRTEEKDVSGEIVLVTGAGHGIGRELALQYTALGCEVICVDINDYGNKETVRDANKLQIGRAHAYKCDVTNREEILALANKIKSEVGLVTVIVNNAGIMPCHLLEQHKPEEIRKIFEINILAHFWILEAFLPHMKLQNRGHIVSLSSMAGLIGMTNLVPYCASKFAVRGMMEALFEEFRENKIPIKITVVNPYIVDTGLCKNPRMRFPNAIGMITPKYAAASIIQAHRQDQLDVSIPRYMLPLSKFARNFPINCQIMTKDFLDSGVDSDLL